MAYIHRRRAEEEGVVRERGWGERGRGTGREREECSSSLPAVVLVVALRVPARSKTTRFISPAALVERKTEGKERKDGVHAQSFLNLIRPLLLVLLLPPSVDIGDLLGVGETCGGGKVEVSGEHQERGKGEEKSGSGRKGWTHPFASSREALSRLFEERRASSAPASRRRSRRREEERKRGERTTYS